MFLAPLRIRHDVGVEPTQPIAAKSDLFLNSPSFPGLVGALATTDTFRSTLTVNPAVLKVSCRGGVGVWLSAANCSYMNGEYR